MKTKTIKIKILNKTIPLQMAKQTLTFSSGAFALVAALAWNSLVQALVNDYIKKFLPAGSGIISLFIYTVIITILAVLVIMQLSDVTQKIDKLTQEKNQKKRKMKRNLKN